MTELGKVDSEAREVIRINMLSQLLKEANEVLAATGLPAVASVVVGVLIGGKKRPDVASTSHPAKGALDQD